MGILIQPAVAADDAGIRALLDHEPMPGRIQIAFLRKPRFVSEEELTGEPSLTLIARDDASGQIVAMASRSVRRAFVNGVRRRIGYLSQLRIDTHYRGLWLVARGFKQFRKLQTEDPVSFNLASIVDNNTEALGVLVRHARQTFPRFREVARLHTLAIRVPWHHRKIAGCAISRATEDQLDRVASFLEANGKGRQFFQCWTADGLRRLQPFGLAASDFFVATRRGQFTGVMALWDQRVFKQTVVHQYPWWMRNTLPILNALARAGLPREGHPLRSAYAAMVCVAEEDTDVFHALLDAVLDEACHRNLDHLLLGLDARDPLLKAASKARHTLYMSRIYSVEWPDECSEVEPFDERPVYVDVAML